MAKAKKGSGKKAKSKLKQKMHGSKRKLIKRRKAFAK
jgi:hypothetical protein